MMVSPALNDGFGLGFGLLTSRSVRPSRPHDGSLNPFSTESCDRMAEWPASACANRAIDSLFGPTYHSECLRPAPPA